MAQDLRQVREKRPLVHNITNFVVMNETANALLCIGALPIMAHALEEVEEMVSCADALVLNVGTLAPEWVDAMVAAGKRANELDIPIVLDPVGAGATRLRTESCKRILDEVRVSIVRGNAAEISVLAGFGGRIKGVESIGHEGDVRQVATELARERECTVALTGAVDVVTGGARTALISNGSPMLARVTGTGCMCSTMVASFAGVQRDAFRAAIGGLTAFGIAGEMAAEESGERPGSFHVALYDALAEISGDEIEARATIEMIEDVQTPSRV
ncbi:MAG: hydroxyethylthiazole kinase [Actinobacteria bacterium]|nr:hydroxyethylthiazole kinase [Actinomycetota bacterium]